MAQATFAAAVMGTSSIKAPDLVFPISYHTCFTSHDNSLPLIKKATRRNGKPAFILSSEELKIMAEPLKHTLICKFSARMPSFDFIKKHFDSLRLRGPWRLGFLDYRHVMIKLELELDYTFLFTKKLHRIENVLVKFLKWTADFDFRSEPPVAPVWIRFPGLKLHLFHKQFLFSLATVFGKPLKLDLPTFNLSRPSAARVLVEMDITLSYANEIWIGSQDEGYWQEVVIDSMPIYCNSCRIFGHNLENCYITKPHLRQKKPSRDSDNELTALRKSSEDAAYVIADLEGTLQTSVVEELLLSNSENQLENGMDLAGEASRQKATNANSPIHAPDPFTCMELQTAIASPITVNTDPVTELPNSTLDSNIQQFPVTGAAEPVTETTTNKSWNALPNCSLDSNIQHIPQTDIPVALKVTTATSSQIHKENSDPQTTIPEELNSSFPTFQLAVLENTSAAIDKQQILEIEDSLIDSAAVFSAVKGKEIDPNCSIPNTDAAMEFTTQSLMGSAVPYAAALPSKLLKHAPVYNSQPKFTNDFISDQGNTDSDSYETYTGSYREEDMQLNEACKEVLEEWQEEWEFQKSKKKQKGIRELKNLFKDRGTIRTALGSRRSLSGHL